MTDEREGLVFEVDSVTYRPGGRRAISWTGRVVIASTPATGIAWVEPGRYPTIPIADVYVCDPTICRFCFAGLDAVAPPRSRVCRNCQPLAVAEARR